MKTKLVNIKKIREARIKKKITLKFMAKSLGLHTASAFYNIETGAIKLSAEHVPIVCSLLDISFQELFFENQLSTSESLEDEHEKNKSGLIENHPTDSKESKVKKAVG